MMSNAGKVFIVSLCVIGASVIGVSYISGARTNTSNCVGNAEVTDLIARLKPLSKNPNDDFWASSGVEVSFYTARVRIKLKMPNNNEFSSIADTLPAAVAQLVAPSDALQTALRGWAIPP